MRFEVVKELDLSSKNVVTQANSLVEARYTVSKNEQLILLAMLSFIDPKDNEFLTYKTSISQFASLLGLDHKNRVKEVKTITARLLSRVVTIETSKGWEMYQWVSYAKANYKEDSLLLKFHDNLKPYLLELKQRFTTFKLSEVIELKSVYAIRIYQLLKDYDGQRKKTFSYSVSDFRDIVLGQNSKKYSVFNNFRVRIIEKAKEELDEKSDFSFSYKTVKVGRSIGKIEFTIIKKQRQKVLSKQNNDKQNDSKSQEIQEMLSIGISPKNADEFLKKYGAEYITEKLQVLAEAQQEQNIKSSSGYFIKALKEDWKSEKSIQRKKQQEAREKVLEERRQEKIKSTISDLEKTFRNKTRKEFLENATEEEKNKIIDKSKELNPIIADMIKDIESPFCLSVLIGKIPDYEQNKQKFINSELEKMGLKQQQEETKNKK